MDVRVGHSITRKFALAGALLLHSAPLVTAGTPVLVSEPVSRWYCPCKPGYNSGLEGAQVAGEKEDKDDGWRVKCGKWESECDWVKYSLVKRPPRSGHRFCKDALEGKSEMFLGLPSGKDQCIEDVTNYKEAESLIAKLNDKQCPSMFPCETCIGVWVLSNSSAKEVPNYDPEGMDEWSKCLNDKLSSGKQEVTNYDTNDSEAEESPKTLIEKRCIGNTWGMCGLKELLKSIFD